MSRRGFSLKEVLLALFIIALAVGVLLPALSIQRIQHRGRSEQANRLKQVALACHNYNDAHNGRLPPLLDVGMTVGQALEKIRHEGVGERVIYFFAVDSDKRLVDLTYNFQKGQLVTIERIEVIGNDKTRDNVIRRELRINEGDLYYCPPGHKLYAIEAFENLEFNPARLAEQTMEAFTTNISKAQA